MLFEGEQPAGPAGGWSWQQLEAVAMTQRQGLFLANHLQRWQGRQWRSGVGFPGGQGFALLPELLQQLGSWIGANQCELRIDLGQAAQQGNPVGVHMPHHHQELKAAFRQCGG